jgi:hypothetical protein
MLVRGGQGELVLSASLGFRQIMLGDPIGYGAETGWTVRAFASANHTEPDIAVEHSCSMA